MVIVVIIQAQWTYSFLRLRFDNSNLVTISHKSQQLSCRDVSKSVFWSHIIKRAKLILSRCGSWAHITFLLLAPGATSLFKMNILVCYEGFLVRTDTDLFSSLSVKLVLSAMMACLRQTEPCLLHSNSMRILRNPSDWKPPFGTYDPLIALLKQCCLEIVSVLS